MDVQMPVIDGYRCTHILRHHVPFKDYADNVPIVAMTASAIQGDKEKCTKAGMDDYLAKPVKSKILERMLVRWTKGRRRGPHGAQSASISASDCSESAEHCFSSEIPTFGFNLDLTAETPENLSSHDDYEDVDDLESEYERLNLPTPKPLRTGSQDPGMYPFGMSQPVRQLEPNEHAMQLRSDKLLGAAGGGAPSMPVGLNVQPEGDSLTEANVEKLEKEGSRRR